MHVRLWWRNLRERDNFGITRRRGDDHIKMGFQETGCDYEDWTDLTVNRQRGRLL
jgi:hypothetical protein